MDTTISDLINKLAVSHGTRAWTLQYQQSTQETTLCHGQARDKVKLDQIQITCDGVQEESVDKDGDTEMLDTGMLDWHDTSQDEGRLELRKTRGLTARYALQRTDQPPVKLVIGGTRTASESLETFGLGKLKGDAMVRRTSSFNFELQGEYQLIPDRVQ